MQALIKLNTLISGHDFIGAEQDKTCILAAAFYIKKRLRNYQMFYCNTLKDTMTIIICLQMYLIFVTFTRARHAQTWHGHTYHAQFEGILRANVNV